MFGWIKDVARAVWDGVTGFVSLLVQVAKWALGRIFNTWEGIITMLGFMPEKKLRVQVKILLDPRTRRPVASRADVEAAVEVARKAFDDLVNVKVVDPSGGSRFLVTIHPEIAPEFVMEPKCDSSGAGQALTRVGRWFRRRVAHTPAGTALGYGTPATVFIVRDVRGTDTAGCFLPFVEYGYVEASGVTRPSTTTPDKTVLAHELGHACDLFHPGGKGTLMNRGANGRRMRLHRWQKAILRTSPRVTYL